MMRLTFLGTAAARPTVGRGVSAIALRREGELMLLDCGEGTQRQMMRYATGFGVARILFTHMHADHLIGLVGLLRTLALQGRADAIELFGPRGSAKILKRAAHLGVERVPFRLDVRELEHQERLEFPEFDLVAFDVAHGTSAIGFSLEEHTRLGRFDVERARALGVPEGPLFGKLHRGMTVQVGDRVVQPSEVVGPARPGRKVVYTGDTRPSRKVVEAAHGADLLIHEATFGEEEADRARETYHSTARGAAEVARDAGVRRLVLTHLSARYTDDPSTLETEARRVFPSTTIAYDGLVIEVPFQEFGPTDDPSRESTTARGATVG